MIKENGILEKVNSEDLGLLRDNPTEFWSGVTEIGANAFARFKWLQKINIPKKRSFLRGYYLSLID